MSTLTPNLAATDNFFDRLISEILDSASVAATPPPTQEPKIMSTKEVFDKLWKLDKFAPPATAWLVPVIKDLGWLEAQVQPTELIPKSRLLDWQNHISYQDRYIPVKLKTGASGQFNSEHCWVETLRTRFNTTHDYKLSHNILLMQQMVKQVAEKLGESLSDHKIYLDEELDTNSLSISVYKDDPEEFGFREATLEHEVTFAGKEGLLCAWCELYCTILGWIKH